LSLITKARDGGADYIFALLTGYREPPVGVVVGEGQWFNPYYPGLKIQMPQPLMDGSIEYEDGTEATMSQMAKDVSVFLAWAAEPELDGLYPFSPVHCLCPTHAAQCRHLPHTPLPPDVCAPRDIKRVKHNIGALREWRDRQSLESAENRESVFFTVPPSPPHTTALCAPRDIKRVKHNSWALTESRYKSSYNVVLRLDRAQEERREACFCSCHGGLLCWLVQALPLVDPQVAQDLLPLNSRVGSHTRSRDEHLAYHVTCLVGCWDGVV